jgi:hypothetical protein
MPLISLSQTHSISFRLQDRIRDLEEKKTSTEPKERVQKGKTLREVPQCQALLSFPDSLALPLF